MSGMYPGMMTRPVLMGAAAGAVTGAHRRRMRSETETEYVRKCVFVEEETSTLELCAVVEGDVVALEYTAMEGAATQRVREWNAKEVAAGGTRRVHETRWRWHGDGEGECDDEVLAEIGGRVCVEKGDALVVGVDEDEDEPLEFGSEEQWDVVYDIESADGLHQRMCRFIDTIELCFEIATEHDVIEVTSHVL